MRVAVSCAVWASFLALPGLAGAVIDMVKPKENGTPITGESTISRYEVQMQKVGPAKKIPVNEIEYMVFELEPTDLKTARMEAVRGDYASALQTLAKINPAADLRRPGMKADYYFYKAMSSAQIALGAGAKEGIQEAGKHLKAFVDENPDSFHYLEACEMLGNLYVSRGGYDKASEYYEKLAEAPWPDYKLHASVLLARSLQSQRKYKEAMAKYDEILAMDVEGKDVEREKSAAKLGRAISLAGTGKSADAIKQLRQLIDKAKENDSDEYYARAYNALGACYKAAGDNKEALLAFVHTDLMYSRAAPEHAEALAYLAVLWKEANQGARGVEATKTLQARYPSSEWARPGAVTAERPGK